MKLLLSGAFDKLGYQKLGMKYILKDGYIVAKSKGKLNGKVLRFPKIYRIVGLQGITSLGGDFWAVYVKNFISKDDHVRKVDNV